MPRTSAAAELNAAHGKTYYLATLLLPPHKRPYVHALYGFARYADEIVDDLDSTLSPTEKAAWLEDWGARFLKGETDDEVLPAIHDTIERWRLPHEHFEAFLDSMRMDLQITEYQTFDDLMTYMYGSAAVIGLQMVPVLEPLPGLEAVSASYARDLGVAFQLANFIRDVGEDLRRGRIYLPMDDLAHFGVTRDHLAAGVVDGKIRRLLAYEIARTREIFRNAAPGVRLLDPTSRDCMRTAITLVRRHSRRGGEGRLPGARPQGRRAHVTAAQGRGARSRTGPRRPKNTHQHKVCVTSAKPKSRSSTGA